MPKDCGARIRPDAIFRCIKAYAAELKKRHRLVWASSIDPEEG
jgi:hypothetical protein